MRILYKLKPLRLLSDLDGKSGFGEKTFWLLSKREFNSVIYDTTWSEDSCPFVHSGGKRVTFHTFLVTYLGCA